MKVSIEGVIQTNPKTGRTEEYVKITNEDGISAKLTIDEASRLFNILGEVLNKLNRDNFAVIKSLLP